MIDKRFTHTQKFLRLPLETQALYFHLTQEADDDGVVEAFPIMRMIGASEDSLGLLEVKGMIRPLNDEMVFFLIDFGIQNTIRKDRYTKSIYHDLISDTNTLELCQPNDNQVATKPQPVVATDKSRLDKSRLDKSRLDKNRVDIEEQFNSYFNYFINLDNKNRNNRAMSLQEFMKLIPDQRIQAITGAKNYTEWYQESGDDTKFSKNSTSFLQDMIFTEYLEKPTSQVKQKPRRSGGMR
nr:phage replisome organiser protein [Lactococcus sp. dk101]